MHDVQTDPEQAREEWHAALRRHDAEDIAAGRRTAEEVSHDNAWIPNPRDWVVSNLARATHALRKQR